MSILFFTILLQVPDRETCVEAIAEQLEENSTYNGCEDQIHGQTKYVKMLAEDLGYTENIDVTEVMKNDVNRKLHGR